MSGRLRWAWLGLAVAVADQVSKGWVERHLMLGERIDVAPCFAWVHVLNTGASFSMLGDASGWQRWFFVAVAVGFSGWILRELARLGPRDTWLAAALALVLGGALGNLVDRLESGAVTDFVLVHWFDRAYFPAFNVADTAITMGATIWIALLVLAGFGRGPLATDPPNPDTRNSS